MGMNAALTLLKKARELLSEENRWFKGALTNGGKGEKRKYCLLGAMTEVAEGNITARRSAETILGTTIREIYGKKGFSTSIPSFNDNDKTTHPMILTALDSAIEKARNEVAS